MSQIALKTYRDRAVLHVAGTTDYGRNLFVAFSTLQGNTSAVEVIRYNEQMVPTGSWRVTPPSNMKLDDFHLFQAGADLFIVHVDHEAISDPNRANTVYFVPDELRGIAVPYPQGQPAQGGKFEMASEPNPNPNPNPNPGPTADEIAHAVLDLMKAQMNGELGDLVQKKAKNGSRQGIQVEVGDPEGVLRFANSPAYLRDQNSLLQVLRDGLYQWQLDRIYQATVSVLTDSTEGRTVVEAAYQILGRPLPQKKGLVSRALGKLRGQ